MKDLVTFALEFATKAHGDQKRFDGSPYIFHPIDVSRIVWKYTADEEMTAAALLHDVLEDTDVKEKDMRIFFGDRVTDLVLMVTKISKPEDGSRAVRKEIDRLHYVSGTADGHLIKLSDIISNMSTTHDLNTGFFIKYLPEQEHLTASLTKAPGRVQHHAWRVLDRAKLALEMRKH